jgi:hypothetical protein
MRRTVQPQAAERENFWNPLFSIYILRVEALSLQEDS